jgi:PAS domain S-box-containing protein
VIAPLRQGREDPRLAMARRLRLIEAPRERRFAHVTRLARELFDVPIAIVNLGEADLEQFQPPENGLDLLVVPDTRADIRFRNHPLVRAEPWIRFYAGQLLRDVEGGRAGTLCLMDRRPRSFGARDALLFRMLAELVEPDVQAVAETDLRALQASEERFRVLAETCPEPMFTVDRHGAIRFVNPAGERTFGYARAELLGRPFEELLAPATRLDLRRRFERYVASGRTGLSVTGLELSGQCRDGTELPIESAVCEFAVDHQRYFTWVTHDVLGRQRAERELRRAIEIAETASKAKSQFLASMSHELRTPLNSVIGFTNVLLKNKHGNLEGDDVKYLERIRANGKHLLELINDVLDLSKVEAGKMELDLGVVALRDLVDTTLAQLEVRTLGKDVKLVFDAPEHVAPIIADGARIKQVIINLMGNALKFTAQGSVTAAVHCDPADGRPIRLSIADTGIGIPAERIDAIFNAFEQADSGTTRNFGGTGLGLAICRSMCQLMGYRISVESTPGVGSTFSIWLDGAALAPQAETAAAGE